MASQKQGKMVSHTLAPHLKESCVDRDRPLICVIARLREYILHHMRLRHLTYTPLDQLPNARNHDRWQTTRGPDAGI